MRLSSQWSGEKIVLCTEQMLVVIGLFP